MKRRLFFSIFSLCLCASVVFFVGCQNRTGNRVVLYCSVDEVYAKPLIKQLEAKTGLQIDALFDTEATKTAGLANRIRAERARVRADVFWSSALLQTLLMSEEGLLETYDSSAARDLPAQFRGKDWAGVGTRARVLVSNTASKQTANLAFLPLAVENRFAISNPQFGTASDWATAWASRNGAAPTLDFFRALKREKVRVLPGNGDVARGVADGQLLLGWTDSDDFLAQKRASKPIFVRETVKNNVLVPGAVSILNRAPHPENAKKLFDAIVSAPNEANLVQQMPGVFSLRRLNQKSNWQSGGVDFSFLMNAPRDDYAKWPTIWRQILEPLNQILN